MTPPDNSNPESSTNSAPPKASSGEPAAAYSIEKGWLLPAKHCPSPNFTQRPLHSIVSLLVIHNISLPPGQFGGGYIEQFFCNQLDHNVHPYFQTLQGVEVSAHCLINREGNATQFVSFNDRAWHAGRSSFCGEQECNDFSIGIELEGTDDIAYTKEQYQTLGKITQALQAHYPAISLERITGHSDIAPGRKTDPGPAFDWPLYKRQLAKA